MESASPIKSLPQSWSGMLSDLVHQKRKGRVRKLFWKLDCLAVLSSSQTVNKRQVTNSWPLMSQLHPLSLFLSVDQWCQDLVHQKTKRRAWYLFWKLDCFTALNGSWLCTRDGWLYSWSVMELAGFTHKVSSSVLIWDAETGSTKKTMRRAWKLFWKLDCLAVPNRSWTVYKRWATKSWLAMESASPTESLPQSWSGMLRLGPPKKKEKSVEIVSETGLSCCTEQFFNCLQEMGDAQLTLNRVSLTQSLVPSLYLDTHFSIKRQRER